MILIDKKELEKILSETLVIENKQSIYRVWDKLKFQCKEVEVVDIDFEYQYYLEDFNNGDSLGEYLTKQGYQLIKTKK